MRIEVLTSLYPSPPRPREGIFAERRWQGMRARGHEIRVTHPLPRTPGPLASLLRPDWGELRDMPRREERGGVSIQRPRYLHLPGRALRNARRFARVGVRHALANGTPDVAVCDYAWPAAEAAPIFARAGIPCVINGRGSDVIQVAEQAELGNELARCLTAASAWCAVSADLVQRMDELRGESGGVLVPNGVDLETFALRDREAARAELGLAQGDGAGPLVLVVGHLIERKDPLLALETVAGCDGARVVFLGRGPLRAAAEARAAELGIVERVSFLGEVAPEALAVWYAAADALLLTSRREGRPNVVLEALAAGCPVLATQAGGTAELLGVWRERSLATTREPAELSRMLRALLADPPQRERLRESVAGYSWEASLDALEECLERARAGART